MGCKKLNFEDYEDLNQCQSAKSVDKNIPFISTSEKWTIPRIRRRAPAKGFYTPTWYDGLASKEKK